MSKRLASHLHLTEPVQLLREHLFRLHQPLPLSPLTPRANTRHKENTSAKTPTRRRNLPTCCSGGSGTTSGSLEVGTSCTYQHTSEFRSIFPSLLAENVSTDQIRTIRSLPEQMPTLQADRTPIYCMQTDEQTEVHTA